MAIYNKNLTNELLQLQFLISQLILRTTWHGDNVYNDPCCRILLCINNILTTFCLPLRTVLINRLVEVQRYGRLNYMGFIFPDIKKVQLQDGAYWPSAKPWREREVDHENLYYWNIHDLMESRETITNDYELLLVTVDAPMTQYILPGIIATMTDSALNAIDLMISVINQPRGEVKRLSRIHTNTIVCNIADILLNSLLILKTHSRNLPDFRDFASKYARQAQMHNSPGLTNYYPPILKTAQDVTDHNIEQLSTQRPAGFITGFPEDLIARIASYFSTSDINTWSHYNSNQEDVNPPERRRKYRKLITAWRDLSNFMRTCKLVENGVKSGKFPFPYDIAREKLIIESMWQAWYTLQECKTIPPPIELEVWNAPPPPCQLAADEYDENAPPDYIVHRWVTERLFKKNVTILANPIHGGPLDPRNHPRVYPQLNPATQSNLQLKHYDHNTHDRTLDYLEEYSGRVQNYLFQIGATANPSQPNSFLTTDQMEEEENQNLKHLYDLHNKVPVDDEAVDTELNIQYSDTTMKTERLHDEILEYETTTHQNLPYCQNHTCQGNCVTCTEMHTARDVGYQQGLQKSTEFLTTADFSNCSTKPARLLHAYNLGLRDAQQEHNKAAAIIPPYHHHDHALQLQLHHDLQQTQHTAAKASAKNTTYESDSDNDSNLALFRENDAKYETRTYDTHTKPPPYASAKHTTYESDSDNDSNLALFRKNDAKHETRTYGTHTQPPAYDSDNDTKPPARKTTKLT
jgi:hypothetical protein